MSEYQYVAFRAIDAPINEANLRYMRKQSTRAEITPWSFDNEYHYGEFSGNAFAMMRRGYDIHLHFADFGVLTLMLRLPVGFPHFAAAKPYLARLGTKYKQDKQGKGGTLTIDPYFEVFELYPEEPFDTILEELAPLREEIMAGDLRPLYLADLVMRGDDNHDPSIEVEGPVPAGLQQLTSAQRKLAELYGLKGEFLAAAAVNSPPLTSPLKQSTAQEWLATLPTSKKDNWLAQFMVGDGAVAQREIVAAYRSSFTPPCWPTAPGTRTIAQLEEQAEASRPKNVF